MIITYGFGEHIIDVTEICLNKLINKKNNVITITNNDLYRTWIFTDPIQYVLKKIFIHLNGIITEYEDHLTIKINMNDYSITTLDHNKILIIHNKLKLLNGSFNHELPQQKMVSIYLTGKEKVLEIGGNIGRNSLVIGYILNQQNNNNFVTLEIDTNLSNELIKNRDLNQLQFFVENSALSKRKLIQKNLETVPSDVLFKGYSNVNIISYDELKKKYNIDFDTFIVDCEAAFYYILLDFPEILDEINLIIMKNDYWELYKKEYIEELLMENNFILDYHESGGWGPCINKFYEVWKKF